MLVALLSELSYRFAELYICFEVKKCPSLILMVVEQFRLMMSRRVRPLLPVSSPTPAGFSENECSSQRDMRLSWSDKRWVLPIELGLLTSLMSLDLRENHLTGSIPSELGRLTKIQELWLPEASQYSQDTPVTPLLKGSSALCRNLLVEILLKAALKEVLILEMWTESTW
jgi:hypothetical protein